MKTKLTTNKILLLLSLAAFTILIFQSFEINDNLEKSPPPGRNFWLLGKGDYFVDSVAQPYKHLVANFPLVQLNGKGENFVSIEGYQNSRQFLKTEVVNDTLYILHTRPQTDTALVAVEGDFPIIVDVGAKTLESITLYEKGNIGIPALPYGATTEGKQVYKPQDWEKNLLTSKSLDLYLNQRTKVKMFLEIDELNIHVSNNPIGRGLSAASEILGKTKSINIIHPNGDFALNGISLETDSLTVISNPASTAYDAGFIRLTCNEYLEAELLYALDIAYSGSPNIVKKERSIGRVINNNTK